MYSLFWKIFLTFWFTILIVELSTAWITVDLSEYEIHPILEKENDKFIASSTEAVSILTSEGLPGLRTWLQQDQNLKGVAEIFGINQRHEEVINRPLPSTVKVILDNDYANQTLSDHYQPIKHMLRFSTTTPDGDDYLVISLFEHPPLIQYLFAPQRVALGVLVSGLICFLLASYFTSPLTRLRRSTAMLTLGEFDTTSLQQLRNRNDEFGALAVDFEKMADRMHDLLNTQKQLLRDISHELRSPLARIRVALGLARNKYQSNDLEEHDRIEMEIERLEFLIRELLTFVKIDPNNAIPMSNVDICELLEHVVTDARYELQQATISQKINLYCPGTIDIYADAHLLHRAIENIIRNAGYYSPNNSTITIRCSLRKTSIQIIIEDEGPGIPEDMLEKIFQPFVRVSTARESDTGGSGIGLAIAKRIVDTHKGTISANNKTGSQGLMVKVCLPLPSKQTSESENVLQ